MDFDSNPFADPVLSKPFQDPSLTQVRRAAASELEEYNPFTDTTPTPAPMAPRSAAPTNTQPAIMKPTEEPPSYSQPQEQTRAADELLRRQEELEKKAAELDRREREMQSLSASAHTGTLLVNMVSCLAWFIVDVGRGVDFGLSILWFLLFTPCSFVCWYRPLYSAFRSDSSFRFFVFFFVYICQFGVYVIQCIGISGWGASGWISALMALNKSIPVGILMILCAALFTALAAQVHGMYRTTGASFEKAQQEFATGVMSNKTVQMAAANAASRAAQETFKEQI